MDSDFSVTVAAGTLRDSVQADATFAHEWTEGGVAVATKFTGAHLLHLSIAACVLNDLYREAAASDLMLAGVRVSASGGFDTATWQSTGIRYDVKVDAAADDAQIDELIRVVDDVAEIPRAVRATAQVQRVPRDG